MNTATNLSNVVNFPVPVDATKRPRPYVKRVDHADLDWEPEAREQFTLVDGQTVRSGDSYAIVRPGMERWPLGHVSDVYKVTGHRQTVEMVLNVCNDIVTPYDRPLMSGHGYRVVHEFSVKDLQVEDMHGLPITSRLTIVHDHTGMHALKARMVVYIGKNALGSIVGSRAIHTASNPEQWKLETERMVLKTLDAQSALMAMLRAADKYMLTETDKEVLKKLKVTPPGGVYIGTLLDSVVQYHKGANSELTWGVWERRMTDGGLLGMAKILPKSYSEDLDEALGKKYFSR